MSVEVRPTSSAEKSREARSLISQRCGTCGRCCTRCRVDQVERDRLAGLPIADQIAVDQEVVDVEVAVIDALPMHGVPDLGDFVDQGSFERDPARAGL